MSLSSSVFASLFPFTAAQQGDDTLAPVADGLGNSLPVSPSAIAPPSEPPDVPQMQMDGGEQPTQSTPDFSPAVARPTMARSTQDEKYQSFDRPDYVAPYSNPKNSNEAAQNALAMGQYDVLHPHNEDHGVKGFLKELLQNFAFGLSNARPGMGLGESLALGAAGAGAGALNRSANEGRAAERDLPLLQKQADAASKQYQMQTNIDNINTDNELNAKKAQQLSDYHQQQITEKTQHDTDTANTAKARQASINRLRFIKNHGNRFDPATATQADINDLATFGETPESMGKFDINRPDVRTVAGKSYQWDGKTWAESGLPADSSKQIVDIDVVDPNTNITHTYSTTSDHAAALQEGLVRTGMQIKASNARQKSQQTFQSGQAALSRQDKLAQWVRSKQISRPQFETQLQGRVKRKQLTPEQAQQALDDFDSVINQPK